MCREGNVRLVNQTYTSPGGLTSVSGVVQVCINQQYVYVCSDNWDNREAEVVCKSLSSSYEAPYYGKHTKELTGIEQTPSREWHSTILHAHIAIIIIMQQTYTFL